MKTQISYAVWCLFFSHCWCQSRYLDIHLFTYCVYLFIYLKHISPSQFMSLPWAPSAGVRKFSQATTVFWFFPNLYASSAYVLSMNIFVCLLQWIYPLIFFFSFFFLWFSHAYADSCKPLRLLELSFHQYSKTSLLLYHTRLSISAKSSCGWATAEFLLCWLTEFSWISYTLGWLWLFSSSARQKSHAL